MDKTIVDIQNKYSKRFEEAALNDTNGLSVLDLDGQRGLYPTEAHTQWVRLCMAETVEEAEDIATSFLHRVDHGRQK